MGCRVADSFREVFKHAQVYTALHNHRSYAKLDPDDLTLEPMVLTIVTRHSKEMTCTLVQVKYCLHKKC